MIRPMIVPLVSEANASVMEIPPIVPGGTGLKWVIKRGGARERMPSSEARVSSRRHAKCLHECAIRRAEKHVNRARYVTRKREERRLFNEI